MTDGSSLTPGETGRGTTSRDSWLPVVTPRLVILAAVLSVIVAMLPLPALASLLVVDAGLFAVALVDWFRAPRPATVGVDREAPPMLTLGSAGEVVWTVRNPTSRPLYVNIADELPPSLSADRRRASVLLEPGGERRAGTAILPSRRGRFEMTEMVVRVEGRLGLFARQGRRQMPTVLRVYPPFRSKQEAELRIEKGRILETGLRSVRAHGGGTEFEQLREYVVDDDFRRIDWAATARSGKPTVRTFRAEQNQNVVLLLDCGRVMAGRVAGIPRVEHAMDAAMTVTAVASRLGDRVGPLAFDQHVRAEVPPGQGVGQLGRVTEAMYELEPQLAESDYRGVFVRAMSRFRRRSLVVLLTDLGEHGAIETLLPALPLIARHHLLIVASVTDPAVAEWAGGDPEELNKAYRKAAAISTLDSRRRNTALLRKRGATVVDAVPGSLSTQLADAYLQVKATGRL